MKNFIFLIALFGFNFLYAQEKPDKEIKTEVNEVTVFFDGAQINRMQIVHLEKGESTLKFIQLSPFIDASSIQVRAVGEITVLSVSHQQNFLDQSEKFGELIQLEEKLKDLEIRLRMQKANLAILKEEMTFLRENRAIGGRSQEINVDNLKEAYSFFGREFSALVHKEIEIDQKLMDLKKEKKGLENQVMTITSTNELPSGEIIVKVNAQQDVSVTFELIYLVSNAGWFPTYDIRAKNISEPLELIYYANVRQDTKEDWDEVKLRFSSTEPNVSGVAPELQTYFLDYHLRPPSYHNQVSRVSGRITDVNGEPIPFATVRVEGTSIGGSADINGQFSLTIPPSATNMMFSFVGYQTKTVAISGKFMNVVLHDGPLLEEVTVLQAESAGIQLDGMRVSGRGPNMRGSRSSIDRATPLLTIQLENQVSVEFEIGIPFTVKSDNKNYSVEISAIYLPADFQYFSIPKIDNSAFLVANVTNWEQYNLLEGEANVFFEDTYVGKTILDVRFLTDTLQLSLGRDKAISINRTKTKDLTTRRFIGTRKQEMRTWKTTVRNNKGQKINMVIYDQVPVSTNSEIEVSIQNLSDAQHNTETGEIKWEFNLEPTTAKEFELQYSVRFPRNRHLIVQ